MRRSDILTTILFVGVISTIFVLNVVTKDKDFSIVENRTLQMFPEMTINRLLSGKVSTDFDNYITDQFVLRDAFVEVKSELEFYLGKDENNSVYLSTNNMLIEGFYEPDYDLIDRSIAGIVNLEKNLEIPIYTMVIPTQSDIYVETLPVHVPIYSQKTVISYIYDQLEENIDIYELLESKKDEYIFYNTDHHWTSLGAYYGYVAIASMLGRDVLDLSEYEVSTMVDNFNGTIYNKSGIRKVNPDTINVYTPNQEIIVDTGAGIISKMLYDESYIDKSDKYSLFLGGNDPVVRIEGEGEGNILFVKDSYTNSMAPFFIKQFKEIHLVDLRFMRAPVSEYVKEFEIDEIIICYSISNFTEDKNLQLIK